MLDLNENDLTQIIYNFLNPWEARKDRGYRRTYIGRRIA